MHPFNNKKKKNEEIRNWRKRTTTMGSWRWGRGKKKEERRRWSAGEEEGEMVSSRRRPLENSFQFPMRHIHVHLAHTSSAFYEVMWFCESIWHSSFLSIPLFFSFSLSLSLALLLFVPLFFSFLSHTSSRLGTHVKDTGLHIHYPAVSYGEKHRN